MYSILTSSIDISSKKFEKCRIKKDKFKVIPGWNRRVKSLHRSAREHYLAWLSNGKDRSGILYDRMNESRKKFKMELKKCKHDESDEISQNIQQKFENKSMKKFWSAVKSKKSINSQSSCIDSAKNTDEIINIFSNKFLAVSDSSNQSESIILNRVNERLSPTIKN